MIDDPSWPRADRWLASAHRRADLLVVGVPTSAASLSPSRADLTPDALRRRLHRFSTFQGEWEVDLETVRVADAGDLPVADLDMAEMLEEVTQLAGALPAADLTLFLGGDNAVTRPLVRRLAPLDGVGLLTFDAHHDVRTLDRGPTNGSPVRGLVEDGLAGDQVVQIGIHSWANSAPYRRYCEEQGIEVVTMARVEDEGIRPVVEEALDRLASRTERIHVDVDVDVLDAAFAPGCPGARPGGMTPRQLAEGVRLCAAHPLVVSMDFVEVDPERDRDGLTLDNLATTFLSAAAGFASRGAT